MDLHMTSRRQAVALLVAGTSLSGCSARRGITADTPRYQEDFSNIYISQNGELLVIRGKYDYIFKVPKPMLLALNSKFRSRIRAHFSIFALDARNEITGLVSLYLAEGEAMSEADQSEAGKLGLFVGMGDRIQMVGKRYVRPSDEKASSKLAMQALNQPYEVYVAEVDHPNAPPPSPIKAHDVGLVIFLGLVMILAAPLGGLCMNCK